MSQGENNVVFCNIATFCKCDLKMMLDLLMVVDKRNKNVCRENIWKPFLKTNVTQIFRLFVRFFSIILMTLIAYCLKFQCLHKQGLRE